MEDRCRQRACCRRELHVLGEERRARTEKTNIGKRILQQCVAGLETLQQLFLLDNRRRKLVKWFCIEALGLSVGAEPHDRIFHRTRSGGETIVVTKQTSTRLKHVAVKRGLGKRIIVERLERHRIDGCAGIYAAQQQPGQQCEQK